MDVFKCLSSGSRPDGRRRPQFRARPSTDHRAQKRSTEHKKQRAVTAAASGVAYFARGDIDPAIAGPVALGSVIGSVLGARFLMAVSGDRLRLLFVIVIVALAAQMLQAAFEGHPMLSMT